MTTNNWKNYKECLIDLEERCISLDDAIAFIETQIAQARSAERKELYDWIQDNRRTVTLVGIETYLNPQHDD